MLEVKVFGLPRFIRHVRKLDASQAKLVKLALGDASELVVGGTKPRVAKATGNAMSSVGSTRPTQKRVTVRAGGDKAPYYPWLDFGGRVGRKKATKRLFFKDGRYMYRYYFDHQDKVHDALRNRLRQIAMRAGLEVS